MDSEWQCFLFVLALAGAGCICVTFVLVASEVTRHRDAARRRRIAANFATSAFTEDADLNVGAAYWHDLSNRTGRRRKFIVSGTVICQGTLARVAETRDTIGQGKGSRTRFQTQVSIHCPANWPDLEVAPQTGWLLSLAMPRAYRKAERLMDQPFDATWRIITLEHSAAAAFLTPELRAWLSEHEGSGWWCIRSGNASLTLERACEGPDIERLLAKLCDFVAIADGEVR
jgi:hypothetical protein